MSITRKDAGKVVAGKSQIIGGIGAPNGTGVTAIEGMGEVHTTVIDLSSVALTGTDNTIMYFAQKVYDGPAGSILVLGATADLAIVGSNGVATSATGDFGLGSATCDSAGALSGTDQNIIPSTAITLSTFAADITGRNAAAIAPLDGSSTNIDYYLNFIIDAGSFTSTGTITVTGTITIAWINLGDY